MADSVTDDLFPPSASAVSGAKGAPPAGRLVLLDLGSGNLDDRVLAAPETFDPTREVNRHLTFGYGAHYCIGAPLARIELPCLFGTLFRRVPTLRLAAPAEALRSRSHLLTGGLDELPVTW